MKLEKMIFPKPEKSSSIKTFNLRITFLALLFIFCPFNSILKVYSQVEKPDLNFLDSIAEYEYGKYYFFSHDYFLCADSLNCIRSLSTEFPEYSGFIIIQTSDGGKNWSKIYTDTTYEYVENGEKKIYWGNQLINAHYLPNHKIILECSSGHKQCGGYTITSTDNGENWDSILIDSIYAEQIYFWRNKQIIKMHYNYGDGYYPFIQHKYLKSTDNGITWERIIIPDEYKNKIYMHFKLIDSNTIYFQIIENPDSHYSSYKFTSVFLKIKENKWFVNEKLSKLLRYPFVPTYRTSNDASLVIQVVNPDSVSLTSYILRTSNNWETLDTVLNYNNFRKYHLKSSHLKNIRYYDSLNIIAFGDDYSLVKTSDGGKNWKQLNIPFFSKDVFDSLIFVNDVEKQTEYYRFVMFHHLQWPTLQKFYISTSGLLSRHGYLYESITNTTDVISSDNTKKDFLLFPNPTTSTTTIKLDEELNGKITAVDLLGNETLVWSGFAPVGDLELDVSHLPAGIYTILISNGYKTEALKMIKE